MIAKAPAPARASQLILLHPDDNVLVAARMITAGQSVELDGGAVVAEADVEAGHKLARRALAAGSKVIKYGAPIGSTTKPVRAGEHLHTHNMKSDYIATHARSGAGGQ